MRRRDFGAVLGAAAVWPLAARAQRAKTAVIGFLNSATPAEFALPVAALRKGLADAGYVEGQSLTIHYRWAEGRYDRLPALAADLVRQRVDLLVSTGGHLSAQAAKRATTTIPIVFTVGADPVRLGLVPSLNRPGGNMTGVNL